MALAEQEAGITAQVDLSRGALEALRDISVAAAKDRPGPLEGVYVKDGTAWATDSWIAVRRYLGDFEGEAILDAKQLAAACKVALKGLGGASLDLATGELTHSAGSAIIRNTLGDQDFPNIERLVPTGEGSVDFIALDPYMIARAATALGCYGKKKSQGTIRYQFTDAMKPVVLRCHTRQGELNHPDDLALVMPVRLS